MTHSQPKRSPALLITILALAGAIPLLAPPAVDAAGATGGAAAKRCYDAKAGKRKTSLGIHQWTARLRVEWCVAGGDNGPIVSVDRDSIVRTGTNWRLISRSGGVDRVNRRRVTAESRFHFRLRYPSFEQNCYPRIALTLFANGGFERSVSTGC